MVMVDVALSDLPLPASLEGFCAAQQARLDDVLDALFTDWLLKVRHPCHLLTYVQRGPCRQQAAAIRVLPSTPFPSPLTLYGLGSCGDAAAGCLHRVLAHK